MQIIYVKVLSELGVHRPGVFNKGYTLRGGRALKKFQIG